MNLRNLSDLTSILSRVFWPQLEIFPFPVLLNSDNCILKRPSSQVHTMSKEKTCNFHVWKVGKICLCVQVATVLRTRKSNCTQSSVYSRKVDLPENFLKNLYISHSRVTRWNGRRYICLLRRLARYMFWRERVGKTSNNHRVSLNSSDGLIYG